MRLSRLPRKRGAEYLPAAAGARRPMAGILLYASVLVVALAYASRHARAEGAPQAFAIAAQSLEGALTELAEEAGVQLLFRTELVEGLRSPGLSGRYTSEEALGKLLQGTGFTYRRDGVGTLTLERIASPQPEPLAQATPPPEPEEEIVTLPEMTVTGSPTDDTSYTPPNATTATKTDTPIIETPYSVQVIPQQVLRDQQVTRIEKALENVSGVFQTEGSAINSGFIVRGFGTNDFYRDGVRSPGGLLTLASKEPANLERIEVLKGPASILYGRIELGGLINQVTKKPLATPYYSLDQQFGSFDLYRTTLDATGPITEDDTLSYRFNLAYESSDSFIDLLRTHEQVFVAPRLRWQPSEDTQADLYVEYTDTSTPFVTGIVALGNRPAPVPRGRNLNEAEAGSEADHLRVGFDWSHAFNDRWKLRHVFDTQISGGEINNGLIPFALTDPAQCSPESCLVSRSFNVSPQLSGEQYFTNLDLTGRLDTWGLEHTLLFGGDYLRVSGVAANDGGFTDVIDLFNPVHTGIPAEALVDPLFTTDVVFGEEWYGLYFQDRIKLPYDIHLLAGFRYDNANAFADTDITEAGVPIPPVNVGDEGDAFTPRGGLLWRPIPELSLYGSYAENFGLSNALQTFNPTPLPPETGQQWEVGLKSELFDGRLTGTLAWFDLTKQNTAQPDPEPARAARGFLVATGEVQSRGLELDVAGEPLPGWRLIASGAYTDIEITEDRQAIFNDDFTEVIGFNNGNEGNRLRGVPRYAGSLWTVFEPEGGPWHGIKLGAGVVARSQREADNSNTVQLPGYAVVNLVAGYSWKLGPSNLSLQLNVDNLLDKEYFTNSIFGSLGQFGAPRTFLGSVRVEF